MATRRRRRRGNPKGKALGFNNLRPAAKSSSASATNTGAEATNTQGTTAPPSA